MLWGMLEFVLSIIDIYSNILNGRKKYITLRTRVFFDLKWFGMTSLAINCHKATFFVGFKHGTKKFFFFFYVGTLVHILTHLSTYSGSITRNMIGSFFLHLFLNKEKDVFTCWPLNWLFPAALHFLETETHHISEEKAIIHDSLN